MNIKKYGIWAIMLVVVVCADIAILHFIIGPKPEPRVVLIDNRPDFGPIDMSKVNPAYEANLRKEYSKLDKNEFPTISWLVKDHLSE